MLWAFIKDLVGRRGGRAGAGNELLAKGIASFNRGSLQRARAELKAAHEADPASYEAAYYFGLACAQSGEFAEAGQSLEAARALHDCADVNNALANVDRLRGSLHDAAQNYRRALTHDVNHLPALANLGLTLRDLGEPRDALQVLDRASEIAPDHVETLFNRALALNDLGETGTSESLIERALSIDPAFAQAHLQRAFTLLKRRDFASGWREYAWRVRIPEVDHWQDYPFALWQGESLAGKRLLVQAEQGLGDQIMFASCLNEVIARAQHVVIECDPRLAKLFTRSFPAATVYRHRIEGEPDWSSEPPPDYRARCGDLPRMLRNQEGDFPPHNGYLTADAARVAHWHERLTAIGPGVKVGLSWRGGTPATGEKLRSIPLDCLRPILSLPHAHFVSLQYGKVGDEIAALRERHAITVHELVSADGALDNVAALIASLDLVITVCTTAAHLTGALGRPGWVLVPAVAEWRYLAAGEGIPWYPSLRLFRQTNLHEWDGVIGTIAHQFNQIHSR